MNEQQQQLTNTLKRKRCDSTEDYSSDDDDAENGDLPQPTKRLNRSSILSREELLALLHDQRLRIEARVTDRSRVSDSFTHYFYNTLLHEYYVIIQEITQGKYPQLPHYMAAQIEHSGHGLPFGFNAEVPSRLVIPSKYRSTT